MREGSADRLVEVQEGLRLLGGPSKAADKNLGPRGTSLNRAGRTKQIDDSPNEVERLSLVSASCGFQTVY